MTRSTGLCRQLFLICMADKMKEKHHLLSPATYRFMLWHLDPWSNLAHYATTWPNLEEFFPAQQNCFRVELVLQSPSCCLCCPSDHRAFVWLSRCHKHHVKGVAQKTEFSQSCNSPKAVLTILQPSQFCQPAGYALESTWSSNLSVFSSPQWQMNSSSINSTGLSAETLCQPAHHSTCKALSIRRGPEKCSKGTRGQSAVDKDCVCSDIHKFMVD